MQITTAFYFHLDENTSEAAGGVECLFLTVHVDQVSTSLTTSY